MRWDTWDFHQIPANVHNLLVATIYAAIAVVDTAAPLSFLGHYTTTDAGIEVTRVHRYCFLLQPYVRLFLNGPFSTLES